MTTVCVIWWIWAWSI